MRLKKKIMRGVTAAVLAAALLTACAGGGEAPAPSNPDNNTMGGGTVTTPTEPEKPTPTEPEKPTPNPTEPEQPEPSEPETPTEPDEPSDGIEWTYKDNGNGTATLTGYNKSGEKVPSGAVTIPRKVGEKKLTVTAIGNNCFYDFGTRSGIAGARRASDGRQAGQYRGHRTFYRRGVVHGVFAYLRSPYDGGPAAWKEPFGFEP